jgi:hypothetical protein
MTPFDVINSCLVLIGLVMVINTMYTIWNFGVGATKEQTV